MIKPIRKAVIPVAGLGTRMLPATKAISKELLPVYDRPIIEHVVKEPIAAGITEIILVTRSGREAIENHFDAHYEPEHRLEKKGKETILGTDKNIIPTGITVTSIRQTDALGLGLGHAVLCAKHLLNNELLLFFYPIYWFLIVSHVIETTAFPSLLRLGTGQRLVRSWLRELIQERLRTTALLILTVR